MANTGNGATIAFDTLSTTFAVTNINLGEQTVEDLEDSDLSTEDFQTFVPGDLATPNEITMTIWWNTTDTPPTAGAVDTMTVTFKQATGESAAATFAGTGYFKTIGYPELVNNTLQQSDVVFKLDGKTGPTYTPATTGA